MATPATPKSSQTNVSNVATKVPGTAQVSRQMVKLFNTDAALTVYYGDSAVTTTTGVPLYPGGESPWIWLSGDLYAITASGTAVVASLELA